MVNQARINPDGDINLPRDVRERFGWRCGDRLIIEESDDTLVLRRVDAGSVADAAIGEAGVVAATETMPDEDFSDWEKPRE